MRKKKYSKKPRLRPKTACLSDRSDKKYKKIKTT